MRVKVQWPPKTLKGWLILVVTVVIGGAAAVLFGVVLLIVLGVAILLAPLILWWARRRMRQAYEQFPEAPRPEPERGGVGPKVIDVEAEVRPKE